MPFTPDEFLDVFAAYNEALWPFAAALWLLTALLCGAVMSRASLPAPLPRLLLAGHWIVMYHAFFFSTINPAAWLFAALFVAQGILLVTVMPSDRWSGDGPGPIRRAGSSAMIAYSLFYPLLAWADGFLYPRMPTFGVPCPTVLLTIGFLLAAPKPSVRLSLIPVSWSVVGATAVSLFGMHADLALPAAGAVLVVDLIVRRSHVMRKLSIASLSLVLVGLVFVPAFSALAQAPQHDHAQQVQKDSMKVGGMQMTEMKMTPRMMEEMAAKKKANTERIIVLMAKVKGASGDAKVAAMADLIGLLVDERAAMQEHCAAMMAAMKK